MKHPIRFLSICGMLLITLTSAFTSDSSQIKKHALLTNNNHQPHVSILNGFSDQDIQYNDTITTNLVAATSDIRAGNGGDVILTDFMHLLYIEFLNPLAKNNPTLPIYSEPADPQAFFVANGIKPTKVSILQNHDGDNISSPVSETAPSYPTTQAVVKLLNVLLLPLDQSPAFQQLAAQDPNGNWNPGNGFFAQFINYILIQQLNVMDGWNHYNRHDNGTKLNIGMFDFDAGYQYFVNRNTPGTYYTHNVGIDHDNLVIKNLTSQINNFMFLLVSYVNVAAGLLNQMLQNVPTPTGQWLALNNLTALSRFNTPQLKDAAANADYEGIIYDDQNGAAVTIFTALPRFMINASYGEGPSRPRTTRDWGKYNEYYLTILHYNGLISGYLNGDQEHNEFIHNAPQNSGHYWAYSDTFNLNSLRAEKGILGVLVFFDAWNAEFNFLVNFQSAIFKNICFDNWTSTSHVTFGITESDFTLTWSDGIDNIFTVQSIMQHLQKAFFPHLTAQITPFAQQFDLLQADYDAVNFGFDRDSNGDIINNHFVNLVTLKILTPAVLALYAKTQKLFAAEQTKILADKNTELNLLYDPINLNYVQHFNGEKLKYKLPNLLTDDPAQYNCLNKADLYLFFADTANKPNHPQYFIHFKAEQLQIQSEYHNAANTVKNNRLPNWAIILILVNASIAFAIIFCLIFAKKFRLSKQVQNTNLDS